MAVVAWRADDPLATLEPAAPILAFDLGGTRLKAAIVAGQAPLAPLIEPTVPTDPAAILAWVARLGRRLLAEHPALGVGICVRGIVDPARGVLVDVNESLTALIGQPLGAILSRELGLPVSVENDARMYALGELVHGAARGAANLVCLTLGTGIGTGVAIGGRVLRGPRGVGGILGGHLTIQADGPRCTCGNIGCLEALIGSSAIVRAAEALLADGRESTLRGAALDPRRIFEAAPSDPVAAAVVGRFAALLGAGIVTMIHAHDPDLVVVGGGLGGAGAQFLPAVQRYVDSHAWTLPRGRVRVVQSALGDAAALLGVATLARGGDRLL